VDGLVPGLLSVLVSVSRGQTFGSGLAVLRPEFGLHFDLQDQISVVAGLQKLKCWCRTRSQRVRSRSRSFGLGTGRISSVACPVDSSCTDDKLRGIRRPTMSRCPQSCASSASGTAESQSRLQSQSKQVPASVAASGRIAAAACK